jgi:excisionase family DNA binding protein
LLDERSDMSAFDDTYLKPSSIAEQLDVHRTQVYKLIKDGTLPHIRIGKSVRVPRSAFEAYLRSRHEAAGAADASGNHETTVDMRAEIESRLAGFEQRTGKDPYAYLDGWKAGAIPDTPDNAELAMDALALRAVLQRETVTS